MHNKTATRRPNIVFNEAAVPYNRCANCNQRVTKLRQSPSAQDARRHLWEITSRTKGACVDQVQDYFHLTEIKVAPAVNTRQREDRCRSRCSVAVPISIFVCTSAADSPVVYGVTARNSRTLEYIDDIKLVFRRIVIKYDIFSTHI